MIIHCWQSRLFLLLILAIVINACQGPIKTKPAVVIKTVKTKKPPIKTPDKTASSNVETDPLLIAEQNATPNGRKILQVGRQMTLVNQKIIRGGCWDYANAVYNRAGYRKNRQTVFKGTKKKGPYADIHLIQSGDFLYYVNHSYNDIEHSAIFVDWVDYKTKTALMLSYAGERRKTPARYKNYDLSNVYRIIRGR